MPENLYIIAITVLLPLTACLLLLQVNPYQALVMRGILGAVAALVYALFGAADVALTEALVGTMLSITLYAVAVRSSLSMRLGLVGSEVDQPQFAGNAAEQSGFPQDVLVNLSHVLRKYHMRLEPVTFPDQAALKAAWMNQELHAALKISCDQPSDYQLQTHVQRLHEILQTEMAIDLIETTVEPCLSSQSGMPREEQG